MLSQILTMVIFLSAKKILKNSYKPSSQKIKSTTSSMTNHSVNTENKTPNPNSSLTKTPNTLPISITFLNADTINPKTTPAEILWNSCT
jgi:hypothetical protein